MTVRPRQLLKTLVEFVGRFWPASKNEETILEEQRAMYRPDTSGLYSREDHR
jgi:hypothetical protein